VVLEAPGGLVEVRAECRNGKAERIFVSEPAQLSPTGWMVPLEVRGLGTLTVDTAYGGDSFVVVDANSPGLLAGGGRGADMARLGVRITRCRRTEQLGFHHPENPDWDAYLLLRLRRRRWPPRPNGWETRSAVAIQPGKVDRSPDRHGGFGADGGAGRPRQIAGARSPAAPAR
jgi:proline racemase